jgi:hypothetical protein
MIGGGIIAIAHGGLWFGLVMIGVSFILIGLSILGGIGSFYLLRFIVKGIIKLCRTMYNGITCRIKERGKA